MRIEAVIFDIGNVLVRFDWQLAEQQFRSRIRNDTDEAREEFVALKNRFELGQISQGAFCKTRFKSSIFEEEPMNSRRSGTASFRRMRKWKNLLFG